MAAPKGNQFWKLRSKHGRDLLFATPKLLWDAACEYFQWCDDNPWKKIEQSRRRSKEKFAELPTARPYTLCGLCVYLDCSQNYIKEFKKHCTNEDFLAIVSRIEHIIETHQFEGATVGAFNANIVARKLGLVDKQEIEHSGGLDDFSKYSTEELEKRAAALRIIDKHE